MGDDLKHITIHWFRHGLRLHDNPSLLHAVKTSKEVYPIFIFDGEVAGTKWAGYNRMRFLHECLEDIDTQLQDKCGGRLYVFQGEPLNLLKILFKEWGITQLTFEQDPEPLWQDRDSAVKVMCDEVKVTCQEFISHTLYNPQVIIQKNGGIPPLTFKLFCGVIDEIGPPNKPTEPIIFQRDQFPVPVNFDKFALKGLKQMGVEPEFAEQDDRVNEWRGGESRAEHLFDLRKTIECEAFQEGIALPNQWKPDLVGPPTSLSPHLRFGCLSPRRFYWEISHEFKKVNPEREVPNSIMTQLIWREFFYVMSVNNPMYAQMENNPICFQINWYRDEEKLKKWEMGETGYPWIDACMNQLRTEGWLHHVGRNAVACFLTRGDLWIHWEDGLQVFFKYLLDADWSVCAGNWMWVSSSAFEDCLQCPMCFSPVTYGMKMDPSGQFVRRYVPNLKNLPLNYMRYVPVLKNMPLKYLYSPWKAPLTVQKEAGCIIGEDYPEPMVDHRQAWRSCKNQMDCIKEKLQERGQFITPSDVEEIRRFFMLPESSARDCRVSELCDAVTVSCI